MSKPTDIDQKQKVIKLSRETIRILRTNTRLRTGGTVGCATYDTGCQTGIAPCSCTKPCCG